MHLVPMHSQEGVRTGHHMLQLMVQGSTLQQPRSEESWVMLHQPRRGVLFWALLINFPWWNHKETGWRMGLRCPAKCGNREVETKRDWHSWETLSCRDTRQEEGGSSRAGVWEVCSWSNLCMWAEKYFMWKVASGAVKGQIFWGRQEVSEGKAHGVSNVCEILTAWPSPCLVLTHASTHSLPLKQSY